MMSKGKRLTPEEVIKTCKERGFFEVKWNLRNLYKIKICRMLVNNGVLKQIMSEESCWRFALKSKGA